jgi:hypothetical protein
MPKLKPATAAKRAMPKRTYKTPDGVIYPMFEAPYKYEITVYKSDCRKAHVGDPNACLIALGARRDPSVIDAFIGSGKDAYLIFKATKLRKAHALHFTIAAAAARVRDYFDTHKGVTTQTVTLSAPTAGRTHEHRKKLNAARAKKIKAGEHTPKKRGQNKSRVLRLGVPHRPRAVIENNVVSLREANA